MTAAPDSVRRAREFTRHTLALWQIPDLADDACLIVSELVTNAVKLLDADRDPDGAASYLPLVRVQLSIVGGRLLIEVWDESDGVPDVQKPDPDSESGRGLYLVNALASQWSYYHPQQGGKIVWAELSLFDNDSKTVVTATLEHANV